jgi:hypothetical protein
VVQIVGHVKQHLSQVGAAWQRRCWQQLMLRDYACVCRVLAKSTVCTESSACCCLPCTINWEQVLQVAALLAALVVALLHRLPQVDRPHAELSADASCFAQVVMHAGSSMDAVISSKSAADGLHQR